MVQESVQLTEFQRSQVSSRPSDFTELNGSSYFGIAIA